MAEIRVRRGILPRAGVTLALVGTLIIAASAGLLYGGTTRATPDKNINSYAVFGWESVNIKGKIATSITGGNIGVNNKGGILSICINGRMRMSDDTQAVGDIIKMSSLCDLWDVFWGEGRVNPASSSAWRNGSGTFKAPIDPIGLPGYPSNPTCDPSKPVASVDDQRPFPPSFENPEPGVYGDLTLLDGSYGRLKAGNYTFCNVKIGRNVWFDLSPETKVTVVGSFSISNESKLGHQDSTNPINNTDPWGPGETAFTQWIVHGKGITNGLTVNFSKHTTIHSSFFAPNGTLGLGNDTSLYGRFWAKNINSDANTRIVVPPCPPGQVNCGPTVTTTTTSTTRPPTTTTTSTTRPPIPTTTTTTTRPPIPTTTTTTTRPPIPTTTSTSTSTTSTSTSTSTTTTTTRPPLPTTTTTSTTQPVTTTTADPG